MSTTRHHRLPAHRLLTAFTLLEVMIVVVVIGILAAIVVPQMASATDHAKSASVQSALGAVRSGIAAFRTRAIIAGDTPFPTAAQLVAPGTVMTSELPVNPYNSLRTMQEVSEAAAAARTVSQPDTYGWNYYVNNATDPATAVFYCNSSEASDVPDGAGGFKGANQL